MKAFLKDLLLREPTWVDQGQGRWVKKRRLRLGVKLMGGVLLALSLAVGVGFVTDLLTVGRPPEAPENGPEGAEAPEAGLELPVARGPEENPVTVTATPLPDAVERKPERPTPMDDTYWILVNKGDYRLSLYHGEDVVKTYSVAVGENPGDKQYVGDHRTPEGNFRVVSIENSSRWKHDFRDGKGPVAGAYGPWFIRLDTGRWKGIGIHGTHDPDSTGTMASEGCIRMLNEDIQELRRYAYRNMRVVIEN